MAPSGVVLVHGSWHGAWVWDSVAERLREAGHQVIAPELPSVGSDATQLGDMYADAAAVRAAIDACGGPVVVCGHSYGGVPVTEAAAGRDDVTHLVYLAAFMPDTDESVYGLLELVDDVLLAPGAGVIVLDDGTHVVDPDLASSALYGDCSPEIAETALSRLEPQLIEAGAQSPRAAAWREIESTYVIASEDRTVSPELQALLATRASSVVTVPTSHSAMLSRPDRVAELLGGLAVR
ncbi:MAG: alpha/beta hydrolase [Gaiellales bacterium]